MSPVQSLMRRRTAIGTNSYRCLRWSPPGFQARLIRGSPICLPNVCYVGVDIAKSEFVADLVGHRSSFPQSAEGHNALLASLPSGAHVICEATGGYKRELVAALHLKGTPVSVVLPRRVRSFAVAQGMLAKTDRIDAVLRSAYARACQPRLHIEIPANLQELSALVRGRQATVERINLEDNYAEHLVDALLVRQANQRKKLVRKQLDELDRAIQVLIASDAQLIWGESRQALF